MKTLIVSLNSKYIHSSLAPWYLKASCQESQGIVDVSEFTINDKEDQILSDIYRKGAHVYAFCCYIWNIPHVMRLAENIKKLLPKCIVVLGGPEVSFDSESILEKNSFIDFVLVGEGEESFPSLLTALSNNQSGLPKVFPDGSYQLIKNLDNIKSPYRETEMLKSIGSRIVYFESSRGCPFSCSYCILSTFDGVRYFSIDGVKKDLDAIMNSDVRQVKFVDRTFNCNKQRAKEIFEFIMSSGSKLNFHFEVAADLFDDTILELLSKAPKGLIQFEIGIQSANGKTLDAVNRATDLEKLFYNVKKILSFGNIHVHLDLIAGLPFEDYKTFQDSFNQVYALKPHQLQLGFLKLLKGSKIRSDEALYNYEYRNFPPYEVLCNDFITFDEISELKGIEDIFDKYYNSGRFGKTVDFVLRKKYESSFDFYRELYIYTKANSNQGALSGKALYTNMLHFLKTKFASNEMELINELLKFDFLKGDNRNTLPEGTHRILREDFRDRCFEFLRSEDNIEKYLPEFTHMPAKQIIKNVHFELFSYNVLAEDLDYAVKAETVVLFNEHYACTIKM